MYNPEDKSCSLLAVVVAQLLFARNGAFFADQKMPKLLQCTMFLTCFDTTTFLQNLMVNKDGITFFPPK